MLSRIRELQLLKTNLQEEVDSSMHRFESKEAAEMEKRKAMLENPEDGEGFVTVTYKRKRGRNSGGGNDGYSRDGAGFVADGAANKKRKGAAELSDFYRFQVCVCVCVFFLCMQSV